MAGRLPVQVGSVSYERQPIADHAINLASTIQTNLKRSLEAIGVVCTWWFHSCTQPLFKTSNDSCQERSMRPAFLCSTCRTS